MTPPNDTVTTKIKEIRKIAEKATPGEWYLKGNSAYVAMRITKTCEDIVADCEMDFDLGQSKRNAQFIVTARAELLNLVSAVEVAIKSLDEIDKNLTIPAAEYVPAIGDCFKLIDNAKEKITQLLGQGEK